MLLEIPTNTSFTQNLHYNLQGCKFSDFSLISDFLRTKETGIELIKYSQNMDNVSIVSKDRFDNGKGLDNPCQNTVSTHSNQFRLSSD